MMFATSVALAEENASNPLSAGNNVDVRWQYFSDFIGLGDKHDVYVDGAQMLTPKLKLKYELHYNFTDVTGSNQSDVEKLIIKPIYFPFETKLNEAWGLRAAVGSDFIIDFRNTKKGIGSGADQIGPLVGVALAHSQSGLVLIPLLQHFFSISSVDVNTTALRLIAIKPFGKGYWAKADVKIPYDWEAKTWPITAELQIGYNFGPSWAIYADGLLGVGNDRPYDAGVGLGLRFKY
jgi:hypothetical protein